MVEFGCVGAEIKWDTVCGLWFCGCGVVLHRKIRVTQLWVELSWVVAIILFMEEDLHPLEIRRILQGLRLVQAAATEH